MAAPQGQWFAAALGLGDRRFPGLNKASKLVGSVARGDVHPLAALQ